MIDFNLLYLEVDKMFKDVESRLANDTSYSFDKADIDTAAIYDFIISCGWNIDDFKRSMISSAIKKYENN